MFWCMVDLLTFCGLRWLRQTHGNTLSSPFLRSSSYLWWAFSLQFPWPMDSIWQRGPALLLKPSPHLPSVTPAKVALTWVASNHKRSADQPHIKSSALWPCRDFAMTIWGLATLNCGLQSQQLSINTSLLEMQHLGSTLEPWNLLLFLLIHSSQLPGMVLLPDI